MKAKTKARWVINLNENAEICVSIGKNVFKDQILTRWKIKKIKLFSDPILSKLSSETWDKINQESKGKLLSKGELIYESGGLFSKKIRAPEDGLFLGIDEFGNIKMEMTSDGEEEIRSPINGKVAKIEDGKLVIEFEAVEFKGEGLIEGKVWGVANFKPIKKIVELNYEHMGQVILTEEINSVFLSKAEVLGVVAVLINKKVTDVDSIKTKLPILVLEESDWNEIMEFNQGKREMLVNSKAGRVLIVIE